MTDPAVEALAEAGERWAVVAGTGGRYSVSSAGRVWSAGARKVLKPAPKGSDGYLTVGVWIGGKRRTQMIHRLVAAAFLGEPRPGMQVRHLNGDPADNRVENLAWGTQRENELDKIRHGRSPANRTECPSGHPYVPENILNDRGRRRCRQCVLDAGKRRRPLTAEQRKRKTDLERARRASRRLVSPWRDA